MENPEYCYTGLKIVPLSNPLTSYQESTWFHGEVVLNQTIYSLY